MRSARREVEDACLQAVWNAEWFGRVYRACGGVIASEAAARERARLWRVALAAVRADARKRKGGRKR